MLLTQANRAAGAVDRPGSGFLAWAMSQAAPLLMKRANGRVLVWVWKSDPDLLVAMAQVQEATAQARAARAMMPMEYDDTESFRSPFLGMGEKLAMPLPPDPRTPLLTWLPNVGCTVEENLLAAAVLPYPLHDRVVRLARDREHREEAEARDAEEERREREQSFDHPQRPRRLRLLVRHVPRRRQQRHRRCQRQRRPNAEQRVDERAGHGQSGEHGPPFRHNMKQRLAPHNPVPPEGDRVSKWRSGRSDQLRDLSTILSLAIHGIMPRSFSPTSSIW